MILGLREAAPLVDAILHIRVTSARGAALISERPECASHVVQEYSAEVLTTARGGRTVAANDQRDPLSVFLPPREARLEPGREYLALLWPNGVAADQLVLPVVSDRLAPGAAAGTLAGLRVPRGELSALARQSLVLPDYKNHPKVVDIDEALAAVGDYGEVHLIVQRGELRYVNKVESYKAIRRGDGAAPGY